MNTGSAVLCRSDERGALCDVRAAMRVSLTHFAAMARAIGWAVWLPALANAQTAEGGAATQKITAAAANPHSVGPAPSEPVTDPVADPRAVVTLGKARFTVLTPELIRLAWAADDNFEDHASFVFLNRRLPVPPFEHEVTDAGQKLTIKTSALALTYTARADGRFGPDNLAIQLAVSGKQVDGHPGVVDAENLQGTTRTLDGALGEKTKEPIEPGLVSRSGWAVVDDSTRPLFDSADFRFLQGEKSPWPWVMERPAGERQDWY